MDWGGEGETVYLINSSEDLDEILQKAATFEKSGQSGFLLQEYIACRNRTLRVVVIGQRVISYWRIQKNDGDFYSNLGKGAVIDAEGDPEQQHKAVALVKQICHKTGINLAGLDVIFSSENDDPDPMLLEINYFFGRKGLGGSEAFYSILLEEIQAWIQYETKTSHPTLSPMILVKTIRNESVTKQGRSENPSGGSAAWPKASAITAAALPLPKT